MDADHNDRKFVDPREQKRLLLQAVKEGNVNEVKMLIDAGADVNAERHQCGKMNMPHLKSPFIIACNPISTPDLSLQTRLVIMKIIIDGGVDVNAITDYCGELISPLMSLCVCDASSEFRRPVHLDTALIIMKVLTDRGADVNAMSHCFSRCFGGGEKKSCLMLASKNKKRIQFLLENGADVNVRDATGFTALHYAIDNFSIMPLIQAQTIECVQILLSHGTEYHRKGFQNNVLKYAAFIGNEIMVEYFILHTKQTDGDIADALELLGAQSQIESLARKPIHVVPFTAKLWERAMKIRFRNPGQPTHKILPDKKYEVFSYEREPQTMEELGEVLSKQNLVFAQSRLIYERVLGEDNPLYLSFVANTLRYPQVQNRTEEQQSDKLLDHALSLSYNYPHLANKTVEFLEEKTSRLLSQFFFDDRHSSFQYLMSFLRTLLNMTMPGNNLFEHLKSQRHQILSIAILFINVFLHIDYAFEVHEIEMFSLSSKETEELKVFYSELARMNPVDNDGRSILHFALDKNIDNNYMHHHKHILDSLDELYIPNNRLTSFLLECGFDVNYRDYNGNSCLMTAASQGYETYDAAYDKYYTNIGDYVSPFGEYKLVIDTLLDTQPHRDVRNKDGKTFVDLLPDEIDEDLGLLSLQCLSARAVADSRVPFVGLVPDSVVSFIKMHQCYLDRSYI